MAENYFKYGISIATEPLPPSAPVVYRDDIHTILHKTKEIGYDAIELQLRDPDKVNAADIQRGCRDTGMEICAIATGLEYSLNGLSMIDDDEAKRAEMRRRLFRDIELAEAFGCPVIIGCVRGNVPAGADKAVYMARFREEMLRVSDYARQRGVTIVLEAINFYVNNYLNSVRETCDFIDSLERDNIQIHIDTHHMAIEEENMLEAVRYAGKRIGYVHFAENNRTYPGACAVDFFNVMKLLKSQNYTGYITLEIAPVPDENICASRGLEYLKKQEDLIRFRSGDA